MELSMTIWEVKVETLEWPMRRFPETSQLQWRRAAGITIQLGKWPCDSPVPCPKVLRRILNILWVFSQFLLYDLTLCLGYCGKRGRDCLYLLTGEGSWGPGELGWFIPGHLCGYWQTWGSGLLCVSQHCSETSPNTRSFPLLFLPTSALLWGETL